MKRIIFDVAGEKVVGNLHLPNIAGPCPAVVLGGPMTSVKEQVTGTYATALAAQGIAALAIDHRHYGESDGKPRQYEYYPHKIADLKAAIQALADQPEIDADRIGAVGVCLGCGYLAHAIQDTPLVRAFVAIAGYYRDAPAMRESDPLGFADKVAQGTRSREHYESTGEVEMVPAVALDRDAAMTLQSTYDYYAIRAAHPNYTNAFAVMSREHFLQFDVQSAAPGLQTPFLMLHGPNALNPQWAEKFYGAVTGPKKRDTLQSNGQTDIYDDPSIVNEATLCAVQFLEVVLQPQKQPASDAGAGQYTDASGLWH
ncbi:MAG: alpha/beta fold hydrolase [Pseudomonadota bacterium]